jgi:hypothetical protein
MTDSTFVEEANEELSTPQFVEYLLAIKPRIPTPMAIPIPSAIPFWMLFLMYPTAVAITSRTIAIANIRMDAVIPHICTHPINSFLFDKIRYRGYL